MAALLQWGRDLTVADSAKSAYNVAGNPKLQWGRDLTVADSPFDEGDRVEGRYASMGPRPDGRG